MKRDEVVKVLEQTTLFGGLDRAILEALAASCLERVYARDHFLWYQGDPGDRLVIIARGLVKVVVHSSNGDQMVLATLGPPEILGELALIDQGPRSASVVAAETTTALSIGRSTLLDLVRRNPTLLEALLMSIGALLRRLTEQASDLVFLDLAGRVAKLLVRLSDDHGRSNHGEMTIDLRLTQTDLANMVGASRPALNRVLQGLVARHLVAVNGHTIIIRDPTALRRRAGL